MKKVLTLALFLSTIASFSLFSQVFPKGPEVVYYGQKGEKPAEDVGGIYDRNSFLYFYGFPSPKNSQYSSRDFKSVSEIESINNSINSTFRYKYYVVKNYVSDKYDKASIENRLKEIPDELKGNHNMVIFVLSGHGDSKGNYYFISSDAQKDHLNTSAISGALIHSTIMDIANKGNRVLLFVDTCFSGKLLDYDFSGITNRFGGVAVFTSCTDKENSFESIRHGGSRYSQALAYVFNGENSDAADGSDNITYKSLYNYLCKKAGRSDQHPQMKTFGNISEMDVIIEKIPLIIEYKDIVEQYYKFISSINESTEKKDFIKALQYAQEANSLSISREDLSSYHTTSAISSLYADYLRTLNLSSFERQEQVLSSHMDIIDNSIINQGELFAIRGDILSEKNGDSMNALDYFIKAYNYPSTHDPAHLSRIMSWIRKYSSARNKSDILFARVLDLYPELSRLTDFNANSLAGYICNYIRLHEPSADIKKKGYDIVSSMAPYGITNDYLAEVAYFNGDMKLVQSLLRPIVLKQQFKKENDLNYADFKIQSGSRYYDMFSETLPNNTMKRIRLQEKQAKNKASFKDFLEEPFYEDIFGAISFTSDFKMFPFGGKGDFFWGFFHVGVDANAGSSLFNNSAYAYSEININSSYPIINGEKIDPTIELISSEEEPTRGVFSYTVTPGLFYKYLSIDCGLGQLWTKTPVLETYKYSYNKSSEVSNGNTSTSTSTSGETTIKKSTETQKNYFTVKPGLSVLIPIHEDGPRIIISGRYRICPKNKDMNGFELSAGLAFPISF